MRRRRPDTTRVDAQTVLRRTLCRCSALSPHTVSTHREDLPIRHPVKILIASPEPFREPDGYTIATSIEEVLVDAGFLADERLVEMEAHEVRPEMATGYSVQIEPSL